MLRAWLREKKTTFVLDLVKVTETLVSTVSVYHFNDVKFQQNFSTVDEIYTNWAAESYLLMF